MGPTLVYYCRYCLTIINGHYDGTTDGRKLKDKKVSACRDMMFILHFMKIRQLDEKLLGGAGDMHML
jgi:hypothetical protein